MNFGTLPIITYILIYVYLQTKYLYLRKFPTCMQNIHYSREIILKSVFLSKTGKDSSSTSENSNSSQTQGETYPFLS